MASERTNAFGSLQRNGIGHGVGVPESCSGAPDRNMRWCVSKGTGTLSLWVERRKTFLSMEGTGGERSFGDFARKKTEPECLCTAREGGEGELHVCATPREGVGGEVPTEMI